MTRATAISPIPRFRARDGRTLLSASTANELVDAINALLNLRGQNGVKVVRAESGYVIEPDPTTADPTEPTGTGSGTLNWRGEWWPGTTYATGDIVIRSSRTNQFDAKSATYVSLADANTGHEPPAGETLADAWWATLARGHWERITVRDPSQPTLGVTDIVCGRPVIALDNAGTKWSMDPADWTDAEIPAAIVGTVAIPVRLEFCLDGEVRHGWTHVWLEPE
jgi:hypothetical protein